MSEGVQRAFERGGVQEVEADVYAFVGLAGSGKSVAREVLSGIGEYPLTDEVSNYVRHRYNNATGDDDVDDNGLGRWAAEQKDEHGNGYFVNEWAKTIKCDQQAAHELDKQPWTEIGLAGVRSPEELDALRRHFTDVTSIVVWAKPDVRYERLTEREGKDMTRDVFHERQERELHDWGALTFFTDNNYYDYIIPNNGDDIASFQRDVELALTGSPIADKFKTEPWPDGLSEDHIPQYL